MTYVKSWFDHPLFIEANAAHVREALWRLPLDLRMSARLVFTAHSIPASMAEASRYEHQLAESAAAVADSVGLTWALVYQSRSGRPSDPWLEPDVCEYLRRERAAGLEAVILCPIGFVCDHIEVLYDLDREAAEVCRDIDLPMVRAEAVNDDPLFLDMMADVVLDTIAWYEGGRPLPIARANAPTPNFQLPNSQSDLNSQLGTVGVGSLGVGRPGSQLRSTRRQEQNRPRWHAPTVVAWKANGAMSGGFDAWPSVTCGL